MKKSFKLGDTVRVSDPTAGPDLAGTVVDVGCSDVLVDFPGWTGGHSAGATEGTTSRWWVDNDDLRLITEASEEEAAREEDAELSVISEVLASLNRLDSERVKHRVLSYVSQRTNDIIE